MEYIQTEFSKELSAIFLKYKKRIESDKNGIHIVDDNIGCSFLIVKATLGSEEYRDTLIHVCGGDVNQKANTKTVECGTCQNKSVKYKSCVACHNFDKWSSTEI